MSFLRTLLAPALTLSLVASFVACGGKTTDGTTSKPVAADKESFITQICESMSPCCSKAGRTANVTQCKAFYTVVIGSTSSFDPAKASDCLAEVKAGGDAICNDDFSGARSCKHVFDSTGTAALGATCKSDSDCAPSAEGSVECASSYSGGKTTHACQLQIVGKVGDGPCVGTIDGSSSSSYSSGSDEGIPTRAYLCDVGQGAFCKSSSHKCEKIASVGGACSGFDSHQCDKSAYCDTTNAKCVARKAVGQACSSWDQCADGAYCDMDAAACKAKVAEGASCSTSSECLSDNCSSGKCGGSPILQIACGG